MGILSDRVALKREFEKAGLKYDQETMKAIEALKAMKAYGMSLGITFEDIEQEEENDE